MALKKIKPRSVKREEKKDSRLNRVSFWVMVALACALILGFLDGSLVGGNGLIHSYKLRKELNALRIVNADLEKSNAEGLALKLALETKDAYTILREARKNNMRLPGEEFWKVDTLGFQTNP